MKNRFYSTFIFLMLLTISCQEKKQVNESPSEEEQSISADWIIGQWIHHTDEGDLLEDWEKMNDSTYLGKSYLLANGDTVFSETLMIQLKQDSITYSSQNLQNQQLKVKDFVGFYQQQDFFEVKNELQAFPKTIKYQSLNDTLLMIEIGGIIDGEEEIQPYQMVRRAKK